MDTKMSNLEILLGLLNLVFGGFMWLLKNAYNDLKEKVKENKEDIEYVKEKAMRKEDFTLFKQELFSRFDRLEDKVDAKLL